MKEVDEILADEAGACIWIPCENSRQAQSLKMKAWRYLKQYKESTGKDPFVMISYKKDEAGNLFLVLTKQKFLSGSFRVSPTGEKTLLAETSIDPNRERMIKAMHEDNLSQEEIFNYFKDLNEAEIALMKELFMAKSKEE